MIESELASGHHFYLMMFKPEEMKTLDQLRLKLTDEGNNLHIIDSDIFQVYRCQKRFQGRFSKRDFLNKNFHSDGTVWYDFYVGSIGTEHDNLLFVCFPYKGIQKELVNKILPEFLKNAIFFKPELDSILTYMRNRTSVDKKEVESIIENYYKGNNRIFTADITRYTSYVVNEDQYSDKVQITGKNPLNSKVFQILKEKQYEEEITLKTSSMKLNCQIEVENNITGQSFTEGTIDILFDHYGNYRFWLPFYDEEHPSKTLIMLNPLYKYFNYIKAFENEDNRRLSDKEDLE